VDFAYFTAQVRSELVPPPDGIRLMCGGAEVVPRIGRVRAWAGGDRPRSLYRYDMTAGNASVAEQLADHYDLVYYSHLTSWFLHRLHVDAPSIVDLDNLDHIVNHAARTNAPATRHWRVWAKWLAQQPVEWIDERRMARLEHECSLDARAVTLCSELDAERSGMSNVVVIGNGYDRTGEPPAGRSGSTLLFVGSLDYTPNADAVRWFANDVLPLVRLEVPDVTFRVVGSGGEALSDVAGVEGVTLAGRVDDLQPELDAAAIAVIPIRFGSGTRLKVVEALANRLPMVSTTLGSEGLGVVDGTHALLADDAKSMASACVRLLRDPQEARHLANEGETLWDEHYRWGPIRAELAELGRRVARGGI